MRRILFFVSLVLVLTPKLSSATEADVGPLTIETIAILGVGFGQHKDGNIEIRTSGFTMAPPGTPGSLNCPDHKYITTLQTAKSYSYIVNLLTVAQTTGASVSLRLSDDPALNAFPGRCSITGVQLN